MPQPAPDELVWDHRKVSEMSRDQLLDLASEVLPYAAHLEREVERLKKTGSAGYGRTGANRRRT